MAATLSSLRTNHCLQVEVIEAKDLNPTNFLSSKASDSYCELCVRDQIVKTTEVQVATVTPKWNEIVQFELPENPEEETLFVSVWGKKLISRNTFNGRIEIPVSLVLKQDNNSKELRFKENRKIVRWFKLLPKAGNQQFSQITGWLKLGFEYKYVPFVPSTVNESMVPPPIAPNAKVVYQCPQCSSFFSPEEIQLHMNSCKLQPNNVPFVQSNHPSGGQNAPAAYNNSQQVQPPLSNPVALKQSGDSSVPNGFSPDPSQPAPNSPPTYFTNSAASPPGYVSNPFEQPVSVQTGFNPTERRTLSYNGSSTESTDFSTPSRRTISEQNDDSLYSAPSYDFSTPY